MNSNKTITNQEIGKLQTISYLLIFTELFLVKQETNTAMKLLLSITFLFTISISFGQTPPQGQIINFDSLMKAAIDRQFPTFEARNQKEQINNKTLQGKVVLINFWFEDCHPCMAEMEALNELYQKLKTNKDFEFISFTWDNSEAVKRVKEKFNLQFKVFQVTQKECYRLNQNNGFPTNILLDKTGKINFLIAGGQIDKDKAREFVMNELLSEIANLL